METSKYFMVVGICFLFVLALAYIVSRRYLRSNLRKQRLGYSNYTISGKQLRLIREQSKKNHKFNAPIVKGADEKIQSGYITFAEGSRLLRKEGTVGSLDTKGLDVDARAKY